MPLLRNSPFRRKKTPKNLVSDTPVFHLELTGEVFTEYEEFCYRIIQCNSLVWTCAETGRTELTFSEALESEREAETMLTYFPEVLKVPALYLASIAQSSEFQELVSDVFNFMEDHYFINELVIPTTKAKWTRGKVTRVDNPEAASTGNAKKKSSANNVTPPSSYRYEVTANINGKSTTFDVSGAKLKRPEAEYPMRDMLSVFLKQYAVLDARGIWVIKGSVLQEYNIQFVKFCDIFVGDPPLVSRSEGKKSINHGDKSGLTKKGSNVVKRIHKNGGTVADEEIKGRNVRATKQDKVKSKYDNIGRQTGQQNIEKYFISSKRSNEVQHNQDEIESEEEKLDDFEKEFKIEPDSDVSVQDVCSEEESGSSGDEIKVVWSSSVRPNRHCMGKLFNKSEDALDLADCSTEIKQEKDEEMEESKEKLLEKSPVFRTAERKAKQSKSQSPKRDLSGKKLSSSSELVPLGKGKPRKKLKQTRMFEQRTTVSGLHSDGNKKTSYKKSLRKDGGSSRRKQKIVGTLKPWVQTTRKEKAPASVTKSQNCGTSPHSVKQKKKNWLEMQREIELKEKQRKQEERLRKKAKLEEDKLKFAIFMKEWKKLREDLLCEDLKPLPVPCEINCRIPNKLFGDFMMVLEFLQSFNTSLKVKSYFPGGVTFEYLEKALVETEIAGPLNDVIRVLLRAIFDLQIAEEAKPRNGVQIATDLNLDNMYDQERNTNIPQEGITDSIVATGWLNIFKDVCLNDIPLDHNTISEVLRLHLLGSGGRARDIASKWSYLHGGYTNFDDPGLWFRLEKPSILLKLSHNHVSELSIGEKLDVLCCLVNQVLTYATVRDKVEDLCEQTRQTKLTVRSLQIAELKLQKEASAKRMQEKKDAKLALAQGTPYVPSEETEDEKLKMEKEINKLRVDMQKKSSRISSLSFGSQLLPLGSDRAHRKFWLFSSLPGLFVEYNPFEIGPCLLQPTPRTLELSDTLTHVRKLFEEEGHNSSDKENDASDRDVSKPHALSVKKMLGEKNNTVETLNTTKQNGKDEQLAQAGNANEGELLICTASDDCPIHCSTVSTSHWSFFAKQDDVTALLECLNERGVRECALRRILKQEEQRIMESVAQCPVHKLNPTKFEECEQRKSTRLNGYKSESVQVKFPPDTPVSYIMEWTIRENILALEKKITNGGVGLLKVKDRMAWRNAIKNGYYDKQCEKHDWEFSTRGGLEQGTEEKKGETSDGEEDETEEAEDEEMECHKTEGGNVTDEDEHTDSQSSDEAKSSLDAESTTYARNAMVKQAKEIDDEYKVQKDDQSCTVVNGRLDYDDMEDCEIIEEIKVQKDDESCAVVNERVDYDDMEDCEIIEEIKVENNSQIVQQSCRTPERIEDLDNDYDPDDDLNLCGVKETEIADKEIHSKEISNLTNVPLSRNPIVRDLARAILQLGQSVDPTCLQKPLARRDSTIKYHMKQWEISLMNTINFSQLFIHHSTLAKSINWSRSTFNASCVICRKRKPFPVKKMIYCDGCNKRYHIYCLKPKLKCVPEGEWSCPSCTPSENKSVVEGSTVEKKRKGSTDVDEDFLSERLVKIRKRYENEVCKKCTRGGVLVFCTICSMGYHSECTYPPIRTSRRHMDNWLCGSCKTEIRPKLSEGEGFPGFQWAPDSSESSETSADESFNGLSGKTSVESEVQSTEEHSECEDSDSVPTRERRGCATVARAKIASFTKRLRTNSWEDDSQGPKTSNVEEYSNTQDNSSVRRSSRRVPFASGDLPLDNAVLQDLLTEMLQHKDAWPFVRPVRKSQVPDYHTKIKRPMDLGTVKYKLNTAEYKTNRDFIKDVLLVFENCFMYNDAETIEYQCGANMAIFFEERSRELGLELKTNGWEME